MLGKELWETLNVRLAAILDGKDDEGRWETDDKGVTYGWFRLTAQKDILPVAKVVAGLGGRVMAITAAQAGHGLTQGVEIAYHFAIGVINCTFSTVLTDPQREAVSITPILRSADWHEREMQELYDVKVLDHPNPRRLFIDAGQQMADNLLVPLSTAMDDSCTTRLWERIMQAQAGSGEEKK